MQNTVRVTGFIMGFLSLGMLVGVALAASPAQAQTTAPGPYYATPSWDQTLPAATRFIVLTNFNSEAVLDRNTGLVWEKSPEEPHYEWAVARLACIDKPVGGQKGWRLPSIPELASLIDPSVAPFGPTLPPGHPFLNVQTADAYWSASRSATDPRNVWVEAFRNGHAFFGVVTDSRPIWCVRGGMNADVY